MCVVQMSRRMFLLGASAAAGAMALGGPVGCARTGVAGSPVGPGAEAVRRLEAQRRTAGQAVVAAQVTARPVQVDLGGTVVSTWGYGDTLPGPLLRARAGDLLQVRVDNRLEADTSIHFHGIAMSNDMDGVPGLTQEPIVAGESFTYEFTAPHPGTYFYHSHTGLQLDRGLYGVVVIDDPAEPGGYDDEWVVVLDDWVDGTGRTPDDVARELGMPAPGRPAPRAGGMGSMMDHGAMGGMGSMMGAESMRSDLLGGAGDVNYSYYLLNGRTPVDPVTLTAAPGQRVRIRLVNAASDTAFRVGLGGHAMTVTHSDGFPVSPRNTDAVLIGMGERFDVLVTLAGGVFPLYAAAEGKPGHAVAVVRTAAGTATTDTRPGELDRRVLLGTALSPAEQVRLPRRSHDNYLSVDMGGTMVPYRWMLNGATFPDTAPLTVAQGQRVRMRLRNMSAMFHPMHVHGHTFALVDGGARKDTVTVRPMQTVEIEFDADNPGQWALHCHNAYHQEAGMMTTLSYRA
ncbi:MULTISPECIES: multicopper oxidase family protein [unclassified Rhodococcus (in: high G+C Gram-positive bacteria)]|uniref:multicopper oxidase family protein n=1 Tax=unclassified Rhodococcus (in: high G+C Gram-positive bacteria) TaxID=192944 RepID=UPI0014822EF5|nr:multicopper oxidase family protein [Rhodococcus sp. M8]